MTTPVEEERDERVAELEAKLARRPAVGVKPPVAAAALAGAIALLWMQRLDAGYFVSPKDPITLGTEGDYHFDRAASNRYAQVHGLPTLRGAYGQLGEETFVVVGVKETPLLVKRRTLDTEKWKPGGSAPQPDQRPFGAAGRMLQREDAEDVYQEAFKQLEKMGEVKPGWILVEGDRPGADLKAALWLGAVGAFAAVNLWLLIRGLSAALDFRRARPKP